LSTRLAPIVRGALGALGALAALAAAAGCGGAGAPASGLARVRAAGVLRWGGDIQGGEPYVFDDPAHPGQLVGFEVEIAAGIARALGVRAEFVQNDWSNLVPSLERGSFDVILNGLEVTPARSDRVIFTRPYYVFAERLLVRRNEARVAGLDSLKGLRVGTLANSQAWEMLRAAGAEAIPYEGVSEPYMDLEGGRTDAVLLDDIIADRYGLTRPALRAVGDVGVGYYAAAVRLGEQDLHDAIDAALAGMASSGELRAIFARWKIDDAREDVLAAWTDADTIRIAKPAEHAVFGWRHLLLFLQGAAMTLIVSVGAMALAVPLGMMLALARLYAPRAVGAVASAYVEVFRGTPVLLQLYLIYYGLAAFVRMDALPAAIIGLGLNYAAYEAEVYRAGIEAVPRGQMEAAVSLGMGTGLALRRIIVPQALRVSLPGVTNDFIALLKDSSLVSVITVVELTKRMTIAAVDVRGWLFPGLLCAALYFAMSYPLSRLARRLEAKLAGEAART